MPDDADELILKMRHLEAQAREGARARSLEGRGAKLRTKAQQIALAAQAEIREAEEQQRAGEEKLLRARAPGLPLLEATDLRAEGTVLIEEARTRAVKARARLAFALDQMDEAGRRDWEAMQASARAEAHGELAEDPLGAGDEAARAAAAGGEATAETAAKAKATSTSTANPTATANANANATPNPTANATPTTTATQNPTATPTTTTTATEPPPPTEAASPGPSSAKKPE